MTWARAMACAAMFPLLVGVTGCRQEEQGRPLQHVQGQYQGQADEKLDAKTERDLQQRGNLMR